MRFMTFYCQLQEIFKYKTFDDHIKKIDIKVAKSRSSTNGRKKSSLKAKKFWREKTLKSLHFGKKQKEKNCKGFGSQQNFQRKISYD